VPAKKGGPLATLRSSRSSGPFSAEKQAVSVILGPPEPQPERRPARRGGLKRHSCSFRGSSAAAGHGGVGWRFGSRRKHSPGEFQLAPSSWQRPSFEAAGQDDLLLQELDHLGRADALLGAASDLLTDRRSHISRQERLSKRLRRGGGL